jgi:hypothetical protein
VRNLVSRIASWCYARNYKRKTTALSETFAPDTFMNKKRKNKIEQVFGNIDYNNIRHQFKHSECGVYSINFILRLLKGETFDHICKNITSDDEINECRPVYFRFK